MMMEARREGVLGGMVCMVMVPCALLALVLWVETAQALTCKNVRSITGELMEKHVSEHRFDDKLSQRSLDLYLELWDPLKLYFLKKDVESFRRQYASEMDDLITAGNCSMLDKVVDVYSQRKKNRLQYVRKLIAKSYDFSVEEQIYLDPEYRRYADSQAAWDEIWRKQLKFQHLPYLASLDGDKIREKLTLRYQRESRRLSEITTEDIYARYLKAFAQSLDSHSNYYTDDEIQEFNISLNLSLLGIGVSISDMDGIPTVMKVIPGGPAFRHGGLQSEDRILGVAQGERGEMQDVVGMDLTDVVRLIRGAKGTTVRLFVKRGEGHEGKKFELQIVRDEVDLRAVAGYYGASGHLMRINDISRTAPVHVGLITLPKFYRDTVRDFREILSSLLEKNIHVLVVDLRGNGGGALDEVVDLSGLFLPQAVILQTKQSGGKIESYAAEVKKSEYDGPLVVLTSLASASASEIFAGAIKDHQRGLVIGDVTTFGKGTVQEMSQNIKVTTSQFYTPSGRSTQIKGVSSHILFPSPLSVEDVGEMHTKYPVAWDTIPPVKPRFKEEYVYDLLIRKLDEFSRKRRSQDRDFAMIRDYILEAQKEKKKGRPFSLKFTGVVFKDSPSSEESKEEAGSSSSTAEEEDEDIRQPPSLVKDPLLRESLYVASDYYYLLQGKQGGGLYQPLDADSSLVGDVDVPRAH